MDEKSLISKSKEGDDKAFEELLTLYHAKIFSHILSIVKLESIAEDMTQETCITAYREIASFQGRSSFFTWLWRIGHNKALGWLRKQKREPLLEFKDALYHPPEKEEEITLDELLAFLPQKQQVVYRMFAIEHKSQKEIAAQLGIPQGTVRSRIYYARKRLIPLIAIEKNRR